MATFGHGLSRDVLCLLLAWASLLVGSQMLVIPYRATLMSNCEGKEYDVVHSQTGYASKIG